MRNAENKGHECPPNYTPQEDKNSHLILTWEVAQTQTQTPYKWLSKNQYQIYFSYQSQQEQTARWTNQNSEQLPVTCSKRGKIRAHKVGLLLVSLLIGGKTGARYLSQ